ncbi:response regulator [Polaribacter dokdonensis]|uniref:CheY chemotaxis protein or a CheY-like REC (Receiver) domain n=1 Tax=Polaribacter dokdonensis DSW-5 TaxID=1300348 RepID=A0A0M9CFE3_9FLAO|nr:response regulator [Polaribacter dokdonensis]KOY51541.1 Two-component system response regulator [Polaribacter dokdonensis DSW-5]SEE09009.1 CheY chemotaxis protein or a CheY-like REC (receiver) domain [Polaribacter dokdonensis DSW-5]
MKSLSILFIDDDEIERLKFKKVCNEFNASNTILEAENGKQALALVNENNPTFDLIISDLNMPVMDGFQFLAELKKNSTLKRIPIVIISSLDDKETIQQCYDLGISSYFKKSEQFSKHKSNLISILDYWQKVVL